MIMGLRVKTIPLTTVNVRSLWISQFKHNGMEHALSAHLLDFQADPNPLKLMLAPKWLSVFLHSIGKSFRRVTSDSRKLPDNWAEVVDKSAVRMVGKAAYCGVPPERFIEADETFLLTQPAETCDSTNQLFCQWYLTSSCEYP